MEKVGYFVDDEHDHADAQSTDAQNADNGQASLGTVEDGQHGGDHTHEPGTDGGQNGQDRLNNAGSSTGQHQRIEKHRNTTFQKFIYAKRPGHSRKQHKEM